MNVPDSALEAWRSTVERLRSLLLSAMAGVRAGHPGVTERRVERAHDEVVRLGVLMGRFEPDRSEEMPVWRDTPANRRYAAKLREAWEAALVVDRERYGEDVGTDGPALVIELLLRRVEEEIRGPASGPP